MGISLGLALALKNPILIRWSGKILYKKLSPPVKTKLARHYKRTKSTTNYMGHKLAIWSILHLSLSLSLSIDTHTHTHTHIYIEPSMSLIHTQLSTWPFYTLTR